MVSCLGVIVQLVVLDKFGVQISVSFFTGFWRKCRCFGPSQIYGIQTKSSKKTHLQKPNNSTQNLENNKHVTCEFCGKDFADRKQSTHLRWSHIENIHMRVLYKCEQCKYEIKTKSLMYNHIDENHVHEHVDLNGLRDLRKKYCKYKT